MEIILKITEVEEGEYRASQGGYKITTDKQEISILMDNSPHCCENFGYICSEDNINDFTGAELLKIEKVDKAYNKKILDVFEKEHLEPEREEAVFINIETSKGTLQFVLYNMQNGYYGHEFKILSEQLKLEGVL